MLTCIIILLLLLMVMFVIADCMQTYWLCPECKAQAEKNTGQDRHLVEFLCKINAELKQIELNGSYSDGTKLNWN